MSEEKITGSCCGRPMNYTKEPQCNYTDACMDEYCCPKLASIETGEPDCKNKAVIPSVTVDSVEGITNLANCFVHVDDINTTFYVDDKHRIMITWAGPVDIPGYDMAHNPEGFRDQIVTDKEKGIAVIYDKQGKGFTFGIYESLNADGSIDEAITNKLDEMAQDGTIETIIASYLDDAILGFDTVADMKASTALVDGGFVQTLGFYNINDGGSALYKIRTKTESDSPNELDLIAVGTNLVAEIVVTNNMSVKQFGAKATGVDNDEDAISQMISKCGYLYVPAGDYLIGNQLVIGQVRDINIKGNIVYTGTGYAIMFTGGNYMNINIKSITCNNGGCVKIAPTSSSPFSFNRIDIQYGTAKYHVVEMDGDSNAICNIFLDGIRWRSTESTSCNITMTNNASNSSFVNEIVFENVNFWTATRTRAGMSVNNASSNDVQLKFEKVNFENSWGIHTVGKVNNIVINDCRIIEIQNDQGWLTFDGYLPKVFISGVGDNYLNIGFITLSNITDNSDFLTTNMTVQDNVTTYLFAGGCVSNRNFTKAFIVPRVMKEYDTTGNITFSDLVMGGGNYNQFRFKGNGWVAFTIPTNLWDIAENNIVIKTDYAISFTLTDGQNTQTFQTKANGLYRATKIGTTIAIEELALPA